MRYFWQTIARKIIFLTNLTFIMDKKLQEALKHFKEPENYFAGIATALTLFPENVLQFHRTRQLETEKEIHHRFVLIFVIRESGHVIVDGEVLPLKTGQAILIFPYQSHYYTRFSHPKNISWLFTTFELGDASRLRPLKGIPLTFNEFEQKKLSNLIEIFSAWYAEKQEDGSEAPLELGLLLISLLRRQQTVIKGSGKKQGPDHPDHSFIQRVMNYVYNNIEKPINISDLAVALAISQSRLRTRFREAVNISLGEFIRRTRIQRACALLHNSDISVSRIADKCGFNSIYSFSRTFRQVTLKSPSDFRKNLKY
jgi:AraC family transcriptional regulator